MTLLRLLGQAGRKRLTKDVVLPIEDMSNESLLRTFFLLKKEGMRRGLLSRYGYLKKEKQHDVKKSD